MHRWIGIASLIAALIAGPAQAEPIRIVAFGDSNTAGFGVPRHLSYPAQLERTLRARGYDVEVVNAGSSGDTTAKALHRFDATFSQPADIAVVFLGRNDLRFGVNPERTRQNLHAIVSRLRERGIAVIVAGFHTRDFSDVAEFHGVAYYPDFFDGVARDGVKLPKYTLFWDILGHLNAAGYSEIVSRLAPVVEEQVVKVFCMRLAEAAMLAPECRSLDTYVELTGTVRRR